MTGEHLPVLLTASLPAAQRGFAPELIAGIEHFLSVEIANPRTRRAYRNALADFVRATPLIHQSASLDGLTSLDFSHWIEHMKARKLSVPTIKQRLAGLRMLFDSLQRQRILPSNPASCVKGPAYKVRRGKTPVLDAEEMRKLIDAINVKTLPGLRDRAMIGTMVYTFARVTAVTSLDVCHVFHQKRRLWLRLAEKGGSTFDVPCHHHLETYLTEWLEAAGIADQPHAPLFQTFSSRGARKLHGRALTGNRMSQPMTWEMIRRRSKDAGIKTPICNHTFRATGITAYLANDGKLERAAYIAGHESTRTTQLYDRRADDISLDEIEKIRF